MFVYGVWKRKTQFLDGRSMAFCSWEKERVLVTSVSVSKLFGAMTYLLWRCIAHQERRKGSISHILRHNASVSSSHPTRLIDDCSHFPDLRQKQHTHHLLIWCQSEAKSHAGNLMVNRCHFRYRMVCVATHTSADLVLSHLCGRGLVMMAGRPLRSSGQVINKLTNT